MVTKDILSRLGMSSERVATHHLELLKLLASQWLDQLHMKEMKAIQRKQEQHIQKLNRRVLKNAASLYQTTTPATNELHKV